MCFLSVPCVNMLQKLVEPHELNGYQRKTSINWAEGSRPWRLDCAGFTSAAFSTQTGKFDAMLGVISHRRKKIVEEIEG